MSKSETKQKRKEIPGVTMAELIKRGEMSEFAHLEEAEVEQEERKSFTEWMKDYGEE
jgi:hypothetical protein